MVKMPDVEPVSAHDVRMSRRQATSRREVKD